MTHPALLIAIVWVALGLLLAKPIGRWLQRSRERDTYDPWSY